jgi:hypothetical protein
VPECTPRLSAAALGVARGQVPSPASVTDRAARQLFDWLGDWGVPLLRAVLITAVLAIQPVAHLRVSSSHKIEA